jgi:SAM-dependent methyltransferase
MTDAANLFTDGKAYERFMGRWSKLVGQRFLTWLDVPRGLRWLDSGCGNGAFTDELIARAAPASVVAVDPSDGQLAFARTRPGSAMAQFQLGDAQSLSFPDGSFDVAVMALVIAFLPEPAKAVGGMTRVVRPGGTVATYMWDLEAGGSPTSPMFNALKSLGMTPSVIPNAPASRLEAMRGFWQAAGLQSVETTVIRIPVTFDSVDDFWNTTTASGGPAGKLIEAMPADAQQQVRKRLGEQLHPGADGRIAYEAFANAVKGRVAR